MSNKYKTILAMFIAFPGMLISLNTIWFALFGVGLLPPCNGDLMAFLRVCVLSSSYFFASFIKWGPIA